MRLRLRGGLVFVSMRLMMHDRRITLKDVLLDTGSAATLFSLDAVAALGLKPEPQGPLRRIRGVGGSEYVFEKSVSMISVGSLRQRDFAIQVGIMDYGMRCDGILGLDFLLQVRAVIDLGERRLRQAG